MFAYRPFGMLVVNPHELECPAWKEEMYESVTPILDHTYYGSAWRISSQDPEHETIMGAFRVIERFEHFALLGNGESPEEQWMVFEDNLRHLEHHSC